MRKIYLRRIYLMRMIATFSLVICVPVMLFFWAGSKRLLGESAMENDALHLERIYYFEEQLDNLRKLSANISLNKEITQNKLESHVWYMYDAINFKRPEDVNAAFGAVSLKCDEIKEA